MEIINKIFYPIWPFEVVLAVMINYFYLLELNQYAYFRLDIFNNVSFELKAVCP